MFLLFRAAAVKHAVQVCEPSTELAGAAQAGLPSFRDIKSSARKAYSKVTALPTY